MKDVLTYAGAVEDLLFKMYTEAGESPHFDDQLKAKAYKYKSALIIQSLMHKNLIDGKTNNEVYELYAFVANGLNVPVLSKFDLAKTLCRYYGFELKNVKVDGKKQRIYSYSGFIRKDFKAKEAANEYYKLKKNEDFLNLTTNVVYDRYKEFCLSENLQALSKIEFSRQVTRHFGFVIKDKKIQGKKYRIFVKSVQD